jgi:glycosyltransferase involved in cell wall biosynthesis
MPWSLVGGVEHSALKVTRATDPDRFTHVMICRSDGPSVQEFFRNAGLEVFPFDIVEPSYRRPSPFWKASRLLAQRLRQSRIDILDCQEYLGAYYGALGGKLAGAKVINSVRNRFREIPLRSRILLRPVDFFTFVSQATWDQFGYKVPQHRGKVIYIGLDQPPYDPAGCLESARSVKQEFGIPAEAKLVGFIARVADQKDHQTFVRAAARITAERPNVRFLIVGQHSATPEMLAYYQEIGALIKTAGLEDRILFTGYRNDTLRILQALDVFAHPTHFEGFPVSILEAMSQARAIVTTAVDGIPEAIIDGQTGFLHAHQDDAELARKIVACLDDEALSRRLGLAARSYCIANFNHQQFVESVTGVYEGVLGASKRA